MSNKSRQGLTLLEVLFVLGVLAVILGGAFVLYSMANTRMQANDLKNEMMMILQVADGFVNEEPGVMFNEWQIQPLVPSRYWSNNKNGQNNGLISPWKSPVNFWYFKGTSDVYYFTASDVPYSICKQLQTMQWSDLGLSINTFSCPQNSTGYISFARNYQSY